jgi:hypothetical protein
MCIYKNGRPNKWHCSNAFSRYNDFEEGNASYIHILNGYFLLEYPAKSTFQTSAVFYFFRCARLKLKFDSNAMLAPSLLLSYLA